MRRQLLMRYPIAVESIVYGVTIQPSVTRFLRLSAPFPLADPPVLGQHFHAGDI